MSLLFWIVVILAGLVSTVSVVAITTVIALVIGQAALLLYSRARVPKAVPTR